ncbi:hypothetical protein JEQ12_015108, partial [Ovis aries]
PPYTGILFEKQPVLLARIARSRGALRLGALLIPRQQTGSQDPQWKVPVLVLLPPWHSGLGGTDPPLQGPGIAPHPTLKQHTDCYEMIWRKCGRSMVFLTLGQFNLTLALGQRSRSAPALAGEEGYHVWSDMAARAPAIIFLFLGKTQKGGNGEKDKKVLFFETEKLQGPREDSIQYLTDKGVCCRSWPRLTVRHELAPTLMTVFTKLDRKGLTALIRGTGLDWSLCQATEQDRWLGCPDSSGHVEEC